MKIQELERKTGLERPSIRFYEKEGLLIPKRLENGYREYSEEDVVLLKKIKLLRQLGMSVDRIRALQQGNEDLSAAIARQAAYHGSQIDEHRRCRAVCEAMQADRAEFSTLDAEHYLKLLREIRIEDYALGRRDFQEPVEKEIHPWRRFFARWLDYGLWSAIISFILIVLLRLRPLPGNFLNVLITIAGMALFIPVEALMLWKFGTTPGKYALGIRLESIQGGNLTWDEALHRSCNVYVQGCGCCIPLLEPVLKLMRYCQMTGRVTRSCILEGPQDMLWDEETEITYRDISVKRGAVIALMLVLIFGI
jgi:DNA-binding transcriptional MerR regulator